MLKNPQLSEILAPPIRERENSNLDIQNNEIFGAGYKVPIVEGVPDFVTHAPESNYSLAFQIPINEYPDDKILTVPSFDASAVPTWFNEEKNKFYFLKDVERGLLLDVGCGQGNRTTFEKLGFHYIGSDISFDSQQRSNEPPDVDLVADTHRLPIRNASIAAINSTAVIEHLYLPYAAVSEWMRILKPGGLLVGSCSFLEAEHYDSQSHYTALGLFRLLRSAGFNVEYIYPGLSLWELHSNSIYFSLPFHEALGRLHKKIYLFLSEIKRRDSSREKIFKHAAILNFVAKKPIQR
jgi:SAM-dependent methyltransferase